MLVQKWILWTGLCISSLAAIAQDSVQYRVLLIGDAGETTPAQQAVIQAAAGKALPGRTAAFFLGDNIYPRGMALSDDKDTTVTRSILQSQYQPLRAQGIPVWFIPGNHDWDRMGPLGLEKIKAQDAFLQVQGDKDLQLLPHDGCPGPEAIELSDSLVVIVFDSEWWLYPFDKSNPGADCDCRTPKDLQLSLEALLYEHRNKMILLADHHPFWSYGSHGGYFSWKDHLFPLTAVNKGLYIPLPVIGSLYPLLRKTFPSQEDLRHPLYKTMIQGINMALARYPNLVQVSGHEHSLQLIKGSHWQVVSGSGSKHTYVKDGKKALYTQSAEGFVTADLLTGNQLRLTYYKYSADGVQPAYVYTIPYNTSSLYTPQAFNSLPQDSMVVRAHPVYDSVSKLHRALFGENYRKEWATPVKLPVLHISQLKGGLSPLKRGGGMQTQSLRLEDPTGKQWVLRSVEKTPEVILPWSLRQTFAKDWLKDAMSAQHPYSALVVPVIANAAQVPHTDPVIGIVAPDTALGVYQKTFAYKLCLFEQREPLGESDNTPKMLEKLRDDNDNSYDSHLFLRARLLDLLIGDWDRHGDQWRWVDAHKGKHKYYTAVPRDRDQVFYVNQGLFPSLASRSWAVPTLQGFGGKIRDVNTFIWKTRFLDAETANLFSHEEWMQITQDFVAAVTDSVLEAALQQLPAAIQPIRNDTLLQQLKERRDNIPAAMDEYYRFINRVADVILSNTDERVEISETGDGKLLVNIRKISKKGKLEDTLASKVYDPKLTKEIRLFIAKGDDSVIINTPTSPIRLRIVGGKGHKVYQVVDSRRRIQLYDRKHKAEFLDEAGRLHKHISNDSITTAIVPTNRYNIALPLVTAAYNLDDGILLGAGLRFTSQGFRKAPYGSRQQITLAHAFATQAYKIKYKGEWIHAIGKTDITVDASALGPDNTQNFFGLGNETPLDKSGDYKRYYRTRFNYYLLDPAFRWQLRRGMYVSVGPSLRYYRLDSADNSGRFISHPSLIGTYDSSTVTSNKLHAGLQVNFVADSRNDALLPAWGSYVHVTAQAYKGSGEDARSFGQLIGEAALYKSLNARSTLVLGNRIGGGLTAGSPAFYQSLFLGGHGNLLGYRQYRFAGHHLVYNNLEARLKLANFASYILPGQIGLVGFYDIGRVWVKGEQSGVWHHGTGGGFYFEPAGIAVVQLVAGHSEEGWYPYFSLGFRF